MSTSQYWLNAAPVGAETYFNRHLSILQADMAKLVELILKPPVSDVIFGDYTKWVSSAMFYPFMTNTGSTEKYLQYGATTTDVPCYEMSVNYANGFSLGEYHYTATYNDFRDYEPYTQLEVYLPFYGFATIKIADVIGKYIQFRLFVDFQTGQGQYVIGVSENSIATTQAPFREKDGSDNSVRILATYTTQIGFEIPLGTLGFADTIRNISLAAIKGAATMGASYAVERGGLAQSTSTEKTVSTARNPQTGRQITTRTRTTTTETDRSSYRKAERINEAFGTAVDCLQNLSLRPQSDKPNNSALGGISYSVQIVKRTAKFVNIGSDYNKLYGRPLGDVRQLSTLTGYTEISAIHIEGTGFGTATQKELAMLEQILSNGIIL